MGATAWKALAELGVNVLDPNLYLDEDVGNAFGSAISPKVFISNGILYVKDVAENEIIQVYSVAGRLLYQITQSARDAGYPVSSFDERLLMVKGSAGWVRKVMNYK